MAEMKNNIRQRPNGTWEGRYYGADGKQHSLYMVLSLHFMIFLGFRLPVAHRRGFLSGMRTLCVFVIAVQIEVIVIPARDAAEAVFIARGFRTKAVAVIARQPAPALTLHGGKARQQAALLAEVIHNGLQFFPECRAFQPGRMAEPARPECMAITAKVAPQMADASMLGICLTMAGVQPVLLFCLDRLPDSLLVQIAFNLCEGVLKRIQGCAGIVAVGW